MNEYRILKLIIDENDGELNFQDLHQISGLSQQEVEESIASLVKKQLIYENECRYFLTDQGRITFASLFSKRMMLILISFSLILGIICYLYYRTH